MTEFREMSLKPELVESLKRMWFVTATEVQEKSIPELLKDRNLLVRAKTGTGKTAAFLIPIMQRISRSGDPEALVVVPTRELALQVSSFAQRLGNPLRIRSTTIYGGASINVQIQALQARPSIVVGTPGRLLDLYERGALDLSRVRFLVLDEADLMLDMGFIGDVEKIISKTPYEKQTMLFSATLPSEITRMAEGYSNGNIARISIGEEEDLTVTTIKHLYAMVPNRLRFSALLAYIKEYSPTKAIIFARTKFEANAVHRVLVSQGHDAILMHGGLTQAARERSLGRFRKGAKFLVATNVAARGLDIADISDIINFGIPKEPNSYVHRVGRSARMGKEGRAVTIASSEQQSEITAIEDYANITMHKIQLNLEPFRNLPLPVRESRDGPDLHSRFQGRGRFSDSGRGGGRGFGRRPFGGRDSGRRGRREDRQGFFQCYERPRSKE